MPNSSTIPTVGRTQATPTLYNNVVKDAIRMVAAAGGNKTIATGAITTTPSAGETHYQVDTESSAATDDLDTINGGATGDIIGLVSADAAREITMRSGVGNIVLKGGTNLKLDVTQAFLLRYNGTNWVPYGGAGATDPTILTNKSGGDLVIGAVVVFNPLYDASFTTCSRSGQSNILGVLSEAILNDGQGHVLSRGLATVLVQGNVARGNWLIASATAGRAADSGTTQRPSFGAIGIAMSAYAGGGAGSVQAMVDVQTYTSTSALQQLSTISTGANTEVVTVSHTIDSGSDLLVVLVSSQKTSTTCKPTSITFDGSALTLFENTDTNSGSKYFGSTIAYLRNPTIKTANVVVTAPASSALRVTCLNFSGSLASPFRTAVNAAAGSSTSISLTPTSSLLDIVIDCVCLETTSAWTPGASQTIKNQYTTTGPQHAVSTKPGAAGTTTMSWTGASSGFSKYASLAIAGS